MYEGMGSEQQRRDTQWKAVSAQFKVSVCLSIATAIAAEGLARWSQSSSMLGNAWDADSRVMIYVSLLYVVILPVLLVRIFAALREYRVPTRALGDRLLFAALAVATLPLIIALPILLLVMGPQAVGSAHAAYMLFAMSLPGMAVGGSVLAYAAALAVWMLFGGMRRMMSTRG